MSRNITEEMKFDPVSKRFVDTNKPQTQPQTQPLKPIKTGGVREKITTFLDEIPCDSTGEKDCKTVVAKVRAAAQDKESEINPVSATIVSPKGIVRGEHNGFMGFLGARDREMFDMISEGK